MVKKIQTEFRSELSLDTINSLLTTKQNQNVTCVDYAPTDNVLKVAKSATLVYNREHASSVTEKVCAILILKYHCFNNVHDI